MGYEQVNDGRVTVLGGARLVEADAVGEIFADLPSGEVVAVVARMASDGAMQVQVMNRHSARLEVFVEGEPVYGPAAQAMATRLPSDAAGTRGDRQVTMTSELAEELEAILSWARIHVANTSTSDQTDRKCYGLISRVAEAFGVQA